MIPETNNGAIRLAEALLVDQNPEVVRALVQFIVQHNDPVLQRSVLAALRGAENSEAILAPTSTDILWQVWAETRHPYLEELLLECGKPASYLYMRLRALSLLKLKQEDVLKGEKELEWIAPLLEACADADIAISEQAWQFLSNLSDPAAQDELCRWIIEHNHPIARQIALSANYAPRTARERALFYLLTEQWEHYEQLDFDAQLLEAIFEAGSNQLRTQIASLARKSGWAGFVEAASGHRASRRLAALNDFEWEVILVLLGRENRWEDLWRLAQAAPARWSARLLRVLNEAGWRPADAEESQALTRFMQAAEICLKQREPLARLARYQATLTGHSRLITALAATPDGKWLASASADHTIRLWNTSTSSLHKVLEAHQGFVMSAAASPAGGLLASGSADKTVRLWNLPDGRLLHTLGGHGGEVACLAFSPDGKTLISGDAHSLAIWEVTSGQRVQFIQKQVNGLASLGLTSDGRLLIASDKEKTLRLWELPGGKLQHTLMDTIIAWVISPDNQYLYSVNHYGVVRQWPLGGAGYSASEGANIVDYSEVKTFSGRAGGDLLSLAQAGRLLVGSERSAIRLWDVSSGSAPRTLPAHQGLVTALAVHPEGNILASGSSHPEESSIRLWNLSNNEFITLEGFTGAVRQLLFSPDGNWLAAADDSSQAPELHLWALDDLGSLLNTPIPLLQPSLTACAQQMLRNSPEGFSAERAWLDFTLALAQWQQRFDIELQDSERQIKLGEFDIEIEFTGR